ncbi:MAG TPA: efflux RND transporter periplasmic adaptor subunit [Verrucomicrobiae bacterium]|nr:efflux RND transporter periplasmic adaptor subunit [Verrucomicrobiae bacterium]
MTISRKRRKLILLALAVLIVAGLVWAGFFRKKEPVITVQTENVKRRDLTEVVVANGKIQPVVQVKISPEVSGEIIDLPFKEGHSVKKGDLIVRIRPDDYIASRDQADAGYKAVLATQTTAEANLRKAEADFKRNQELLAARLVSQADFDQYQAAYEVAQAQLTSAQRQVEVARATLDYAEKQLLKTAIVSPLDGTISKLNSQAGERVLGTVENVGTEIMTISDLNQMEARVDVGEIDVVLIHPGQKARLDVDAFKDRKFTGVVTDIANSSKNTGSLSTGSTQSQEATKFEVRIRVTDNEAFRPGMSVSAEIETRYRTNALTVPLASVTTRAPTPPKTGASSKNTAMASATNADVSADPTNAPPSDKKSRESAPPAEVVFVVEGNHVKMVPVKIGISDEDYWEITDGLTEGQEVVSGGYKAISRDLQDGKKIHKGPATDMEPKT